MSNTIKVNPTEVNITPNGEITWHVSDMADGRLYTPSTAAPIDDPMLLINHYLGNPESHQTINYGGEAVVRDVAGYALKHYNTPSNQQYHAGENTYGSISDLRANVALTEGLKHVEQPSDIDYSIRGVEIHAVYIPDTPYISEDSNPQIQALWLMERLTDTGSEYGACLNKQERLRMRRLYDSALNLYGIPDYAVEYDDQVGAGNTMVTRMPTASERGQLVKYDSYAQEDWLDF